MSRRVIIVVAAGLALSACDTASPPPPPFIPHYAGVQHTPGQSGFSQNTFCLSPADSQLRVFESGRPSGNSYSASVVDVSQRPATDPWRCT